MSNKIVPKTTFFKIFFVRAEIQGRRADIEKRFLWTIIRLSDNIKKIKVMMMRYLKKITATVLSVAMILGVFVFASGFEASALSAGANVKGNTVCEALKMDGAAYMNWLLCHERDDYYLGTPYIGYDHRNPNGDCQGAYGVFDKKGVPGMNCMGFIWHVLYKATGFSDGKMSELWRAMYRFSFYRGLNITRRYFANKQEMLDSGYLEKGDIIWMILDQNEEMDHPAHHTGIYWGDGHSDLLWHSNTVTGGQGKCNAISKIYPSVDRNTMYIVLKVGAVTLSKPKLVSAVNTKDGIKITWNKVKGASKYRVFVKTPEKWKKLGDTTGTSYTYTGAAEGEECLFTVRCVTSCGKGFTSMYDSKGISCKRNTQPETVAPVPATETTIPATEEPVPATEESIPSTEPPIPERYILGDTDGDGPVNISDATAIHLRLADMPTKAYFGYAADIDGDGEVSILDATYIQRYLASYEVPFPVNEWVVG